MTEPTIRVLLVDDDPLVRAGLKLMLAGADGVTVAGEASDGDEVDAAVARADPHVVLLDVRMPRMDGVTALRGLRATPRGSRVAVIVLTTFRTDAVVLDALRAGAPVFLPPPPPPEARGAAAPPPAAGQPIVSPSVLAQLIEHARAGAAPAAPDLRDAGLSQREYDVALAVADGLGNAEIAEQLFLSLGTVKAHISSALTKLGLENRVQLAIRAHDARPRG
ncbi:response regulator transcription factor [Cellulomonas fengjieae]|uniref:response regulator transcription factor n=1 Tax=Cellulomonas fengjieae TaxID=2819978 RepID=UPI001AAFB275|nr:response regulator transcription factor [Cellulomonas fengjieae]MBO3103927.1 response regulator transcription factor [Cellulomonas fengjieae]